MPRSFYTRCARVVTVAALLAGAPAAAQPRADDANANLCGLRLPDSTAAAASACLACHGRQSHGGHPYGFDYARGRAATAGLRPIDEVRRRGLDLPDGQVNCVTCHDPKSPWKFHIRIPGNATPTPAVDVTRRVTYENPRALPPPRPGDAVGVKPLCLACHAVD